MCNKQYYDKIICGYNQVLGNYVELIEDQKIVALITHNLGFRAHLAGGLEFKLIVEKLGAFVFKKNFESEAEINAEIVNQLKIIQSVMDKNVKKI